MLSNRINVRASATAVVALLLGACGGGDGESTGATSTVKVSITDAPVESAQEVVRGPLPSSPAT